MVSIRINPQDLSRALLVEGTSGTIAPKNLMKDGNGMILEWADFLRKDLGFRPVTTTLGRTTVFSGKPRSHERFTILPLVN